MQTYYVTMNRPISAGGKIKAVRAENLNNLRRNLGKELNLHDIAFVYAGQTSDTLKGSLSRYGPMDNAPDLLWADRFGFLRPISATNGRAVRY